MRVVIHMIDDDLLKPDSFEEFAKTPKAEHLVPDSIAREREREQFVSKLEDGPSTVVLTHIDADGYSSAALIADYRGPDTVVQPLSYHGAYDLRDALDDLAKEATSETTVYIVDLAANDHHIEGHLLPLEHAGIDVIWYDHHQWDDDTRDAVERAGVTLVVDEDECAASFLARDLGQHYDGGGIAADFDAHLEELAAVTKDIDLWIKDDPRSERLNAFSTIANHDEYIDTVLKHGVDWPDSVDSRIDDHLEFQRRLEEVAIEDRSPISTVGGYDVVSTYSRGGRSSTIGNTLVEDLEVADVAIVMKTHGGIGTYSDSSRDGFVLCHEVADQLGGGGHPTAAGCSVPARTFRELAAYWESCGESVTDDVVEAVHHVATFEDELMEANASGSA